jgi:DNA-binding transcriptional LysR family regulator
MIHSPLASADQLSVQQLRSFCVVFQKQSYAAAAREIGLTVPAIWEQVRAVEARYQAALFRRRGRRIESTPTAALLYDELRPLLAGLDSTFSLVSEAQGERPHTLTLVTGARAMFEDLAAPLLAFRARFGHVRLRLLDSGTGRAAELIAGEKADLALSLEPGPGMVGKDISVERAYRIEYLAVFPRRHPLAASPKLRLADLAAHPLIVGHEGTYGRQLLDQALHRERLTERVQIVAETDNSGFTIACVRAGMGVGVVAGRPAGVLCRGLASRSLAMHLGEAWIAFLSNRGRRPTATLQALMRLIRAV